MKISIITVCYNSEQTIRDTIESVLSQTHLEIEYIVVDGASTDNTLKIIDEYRDRVTHLISEPDSGLYDAMNKGIEVSTGDFIGILNSDDVFYNSVSVSSLVDFIDDDSSLEAVYSDLIYVQKNDLNKQTRTYKIKNCSLWKVRFGFMIPHPTFYVRKQFFRKLGMYKTNYRVAADFELMLRFMLNGVKISRCPMIMVKMREGGISSNGFWWRVHQNIEIVRACRDNKFYTNLLFIGLKIPFKIISRYL